MQNYNIIFNRNGFQSPNLTHLIYDIYKFAEIFGIIYIILNQTMDTNLDRVTLKKNSEKI